MLVPVIPGRVLESLRFQLVLVRVLVAMTFLCLRHGDVIITCFILEVATRFQLVDASLHVSKKRVTLS